MGTRALVLQGACPSVQGRRWNLARRTRLGRLPVVDIAIDEPSLSRVHAELVPEARGWAVYDLGSMNGTFVNGERLGRAGVFLHAQDILQLGDVVFTIGDGSRHSDVRQPAGGGTTFAERASSWLDWNNLEAAFAGEPADRAREIVSNLLRIGRCGGPYDSLEASLRSVLWQAAEVVGATHGVAALFGGRGEWGWHTQVVDCFGGMRETGVWSRPGLLNTPRTAGRSGLYEVLHPAPGESPFVILTLLRVGEQPRAVVGLARATDGPAFSKRDLVLADAVALAASATVQAVAQHHDQQQQLLLKTLTTLTQLVHLRDDRTASHGQRVTDYALLLANQLGLSEEHEQMLRIGTPLHDLGKIGLSDALLTKSGPLSMGEVAAIRNNMLQAAELIEQIPSLSPFIAIVRNCRERWDGTGFPDRLSGTRIPIVARIVAVVEAFDAMVTQQPYRPALPLSRAFEELRAGAGTQFDPTCVEAFLKLGGELEESTRQRNQATSTMSVAQLRAQLAKAAH